MSLRQAGRTRAPLLLVLIAWLFAPGAAATITLHDDAGTEISLDAPATRIVALAPHITELLFAAGAGSKVVAVVSYSDYPPAARALPRLGSYQSVSDEALLALRPDLVVAWLSGNGADRIARLRDLGLTVYANEPGTLPDVARALRAFGTLAGTGIAAQRAADLFEQGYNELAGTYSGRARLGVFYQVWDDPLTTLNGAHLVSDVIRLCGGRNVFGDAIPIAPRVSVEAVIRANPDVIVASGMAQARPEWLRHWRAWETIAAVRHEDLYFVPPDLLQRHTPRILDGARQLCGQLEAARQKRTAP